MDKNWIVIRTDSSEEIGIGHAMRCLAFAEWCDEQLIQIIMISNKVTEFVKEQAKALNVEVVTFGVRDSKAEQGPYGKLPHSKWLEGSEDEDAVKTKELIEKFESIFKKKPMVVVVDHYGIGQQWESKIKRLAPIFAIDDLNDRAHDCKWLLDQTYNKPLQSYKNLVPEETRLLLGPKYALLRKEFSSTSNAALKVSNSLKPNILVSMGGTDIVNATSALLSYFLSSGLSQQAELTVVVSSGNPHLQEVLTLSEKTKSLVKIDSTKMAELMEDACFCIGAPGSSTWERCAKGLPTISIAIAENQMEILGSLSKDGLTQNLGVFPNIDWAAINDFVEWFSTKPKEVELLKSNLRNVCDGFGAKRVLEYILADINNPTLEPIGK